MRNSPRCLKIRQPKNSVHVTPASFALAV
jgi:hypothetical protein